MGMYNEVFAKCPKCGSRCCMQISQVVLGFGEFDLNDLSTFSDLSDSETTTVKNYVLEKDFYCNGGHSSSWNDESEVGCGNVFNPLKNHTNKEERTKNILFGD